MQPKIFGSLERDIMAILWQRGELSVRDVADELAKSRKIAYTTVMTVMQRLKEKGILKRTLQGSAYLYTPSSDRQHFFQRLFRDIVSSIKEDFGDVAVASFLDELERGRKL